MFLGDDRRLRLYSWIMKQGLDKSKLDTLIVEGGVDTTSIALKARMLGLKVIEETLEDTKQDITYIISPDTIKIYRNNIFRNLKVNIKKKN